MCKTLHFYRQSLYDSQFEIYLSVDCTTEVECGDSRSKINIKTVGFNMDLVRFISVKFLYQLLIICPDTSRNMKFTYRGKLIIT